MSDEVVETQMVKVQRMLLAGPVCATTFLQAYISAARSRVSDLKTKRGWSITTEPCDHHDTHRTKTIQYRVVHDPVCRCPRCQNQPVITWGTNPTKPRHGDWSAKTDYAAELVTGEQLSLV